MNKKLTLLLIFLLVASLVSISGIGIAFPSAQKPKLNASANSPQNQSNPADTSGSQERVIIHFKAAADADLIKRSNGKVRRVLQNSKALAIEIPSNALQGLRNNPLVAEIEPDQIIEVKQILDWGIASVNAPAAWNSNYTGKNIRIAVIDTGIAPHEDLVIAGGASFVAYSSSYTDDNGHGSHVAGIIGARNNSIGTVGVAYESNLYAVKVLDQNGSGYLSDVIAGIEWAITNQMDIINLSLGANSSSTALKDAVDKAYNQGILVVAAAGNDGLIDGSGDTVDYPARYASAIAVAATDSNNLRASFSSTGTSVEVAAPGLSILSTYLNNNYVRMSGTSMATPYVTGNLALLKQAYPGLTASQLRQKLQQLVIDLGVSGMDTWYGYGLIQAPISIPSPSPTVSPSPSPSSSPTATPSPSPSPSLTPTPIGNLTTTTTLTLSKNIINSNTKLYLYVTVKDQSAKALPSAIVDLKITSPQGKVSSAKGQTNSNGNLTFLFQTNKTMNAGTYQVNLLSSKVNYQSSTAVSSFIIR